MNNHSMPAAITGVAVAAIAAGAAAYVMNHTTCKQRRRALKRATARMSELMDAVADGASRTFIG